MEREAGRLVGLTLLVVLAGCAGFTGNTTPTVTPAPVPEETQTETPPPELAPGLTGEGIDDPLALTTAHFGHIRGNSYTAHTERTVRHTNGTLLLQRRGRIELGERGWSRRVLEHAGPDATGRPSRIETWRNKTLYLVALTDDGETSYDGRETSGYNERLYSVHETAPGSRQLFSLLQSFETETVERTESGAYRVRSTELARPDQLERVLRESPLRNVSFTAVVRPNGLVESYELRYETERGGEFVSVTRRLSHEDVGATRVEEPPWFDAAVNRTEDR